MIGFWIAAGVLSALAAGLVLHRGATLRPDLADSTMRLYQRQLAEIDDLADRGLIEGEARAQAHAEAARRLLAAAEAPEAPWSADGRGVALGIAGGAPILALGVYLLIGSLGLGDQPFAKRFAEWRAADPATLSAPQMAVVLGAMTRDKPSDPEGFRYLAMARDASGDAPGAARALRAAIKLAPGRADLWEMLGEMLVAQADGGAPADAQDAFREALKRDPRSVIARFHLARVEVIQGDRDKGLAVWRGLLAELPKDDPRREGLAGAITEAERPVAAPAPGAPTLQVIRGMVAGLAARLETQPDDPDGWVRLVRSYAVLGDVAQRDAALAKANARYAGKPAVMEQLKAAAQTEPMR